MERRTETLNLRVTSELKELVRLAAEREHRSISNLVEVLVREYCTKHGVKANSGAGKAPSKSAV
jgi:hypothetical protein